MEIQKHLWEQRAELLRLTNNNKEIKNV